MGHSQTKINDIITTGPGQMNDSILLLITLDKMKALEKYLINTCIKRNELEYLSGNFSYNNYVTGK